MKKHFYLLAFVTLGLMIAALVNALSQLYYLHLLDANYAKYSFGLSWADLEQVHSFFFLMLLVVCGFWGYFSGKYWWQQIYVLKKFKHKRWRRLWRFA